MVCPKMVEGSIKYSFHFDWPFSGRSVFLSDQHISLCDIQGISVKLAYDFSIFFLLLSEVLREDLRVFELRLM